MRAAPIAVVLAFAACRSPDPAPAPTPPPAPKPVADQPPPRNAEPAATPATSGPVANREGAPKVEVERLPSGLLVSWAPPAGGNTSLLQLGLAAGAQHGAPGLAELALEVLVASGDAARGRKPLRQEVQELGGLLQVEIGAASSWLTIEVPVGRWPQALQALGRALAAPNLSRHQLERLREALLDQRAAAIWSQRSQEAARAVLLGSLDTHDHVAALLDRDVGELPLFTARHYRPRGAILSLRTPGPRAKVVTEVEGALAEWTAAPATAAGPATNPSPRPPARGLAWSPAVGAVATELSVVVVLPDTRLADAAGRWTLAACLSRDGRAGRLQQVQQERGLGAIEWQSRLVASGERIALVLTASAPPEVAYRLWQCVAAAKQSLLDAPPTSLELATAARSAALMLRLAAPDRRSALRTAGWQLLSDHPGIESALRQIADQPSLDRQLAAQWLEELPIAGIAIGGTVPPKANDVRTFELLPPGALTRLLGGGAEPAQTAAAAPWLDDALAAAGGRNLLRELRGYKATFTRTAEQAPPCDELVDWFGPDLLHRERTLLGKTIVTDLRGGTASEALGDRRIALDAAAAARLQREYSRHPLLLLAAYARDELRFRPVAQRRNGDRELMVLEALDGRFDRLRIHLDVASHLIRVVEVWEATAAGTTTYLQELWSDYRSCDGVRAPFHCVVELDDGAHRIELTCREWTPTFSLGR